MEETRLRRNHNAKFRRKARRDAWFSENGPCKGCGSWIGLELDHIDPATKVSHDPWLWSKAKREAELSKCQALCKKCHTKKTLPSLLVAAQKRIGTQQERTIHKEVWQIQCIGCGTAFSKSAAKERFADKIRSDGPFCGAVCRGRAAARKRWAQHRNSENTKTKDALIIEAGRRGDPVSAIAKVLRVRPSRIRRLLDEKGIVRRKREIRYGER